ncbi:VOC family protein [Subsaxibacter sp. CAU 1640]|uniref:VOC family protein n=1 Tax=Subsaxibacter sp. CAU 1640 TaxID=2933271 RepID=UPI0020045171|nr:VOC family protein [Subsaxibacter sp. CAU 1640]MCK7590498.1 VOC family protein [Subsaxibacter sp. CAU 1640]
MDKRNAVGWFEIYVQDINRAQQFYETVLQIKMEPLPTPDNMEGGLKMVMFPGHPDKPGAGGSLVYMQGFEAGMSSTIIYFSSEDCANEESRIEKAGGKIFKSKFPIGDYGFIVLAYDTEGTMFGVHSMK